MREERLRSAIVSALPELADSEFTLLTAGWDSIAVDADDRLIFKFPRHPEAERALLMEAGLLAVVRPAVTVDVPDLTIHAGEPVFSQHRKLPGEHLLTAQYERLSRTFRDRLAADLARFYAELHGLDAGTMEAAGAAPIRAWLAPDDILRKVWRVLPSELQGYARRTISAWQAAGPDPYGTTYGFFDGHGWNMAFDHARERLNGIYDFGDSGIGPLQQEFIYSDWISPDLTARIIAGYEALTGRHIDRERVKVLSGVLRLSELAEYADDPEHAPAMVQHVRDWAARE